MNPIMMAGVMAGVRASQNKGIKPTYTPPEKKTEIKWDVGEDRFECLQEVGNKIRSGWYNIPEGKTVDVTQLEVQKTNPKKTHYNRAMLLGAATAVGVACCVATAGGALVAAGVVTGASALGTLIEGIKGKRASSQGEKTKEIRSGHLQVQQDKEKDGKQLVYIETRNWKGDVPLNERNPTVISWVGH